jgi:hypothetical protein
MWRQRRSSHSSVDPAEPCQQFRRQVVERLAVGFDHNVDEVRVRCHRGKLAPAATSGAAWSAAWEIHDWFDSGGSGSADLTVLRKCLTAVGLRNAAFASAARAAEGGYLPLPVGVGTGGGPGCKWQRSPPARQVAAAAAARSGDR